MKKAGRRKCCFEGCNETNSSSNLFSFPKATDDAELKRIMLWRENSKNPVLAHKPLDTLWGRYYVCPKHFRPDQFLVPGSKKRLNRRAVPDVNQVLPDRSWFQRVGWSNLDTDSDPSLRKLVKRRCSVLGCSGNNVNSMLHTYPPVKANNSSQEERCKAWVARVGNPKLLYFPLKDLCYKFFVCCRHFSERQFTFKRLKDDAVPDIFGNYGEVGGSHTVSPSSEEIVVYSNNSEEEAANKQVTEQATKEQTFREQSTEELLAEEAPSESIPPLRGRRRVKPTRRCCVPTCASTELKTKMHAFPLFQCSDEIGQVVMRRDAFERLRDKPDEASLCAKWQQACGISPNQDLSNLKICTAHFTADDYYMEGNITRLKLDAIPSVCVPHPISNTDHMGVATDSDQLFCPDKFGDQSGRETDEGLGADSGYLSNILNIKEGPDKPVDIAAVSFPMVAVSIDEPDSSTSPSVQSQYYKDKHPTPRLSSAGPRVSEVVMENVAARRKRSQVIKFSKASSNKALKVKRLQATNRRLTARILELKRRLLGEEMQFSKVGNLDVRLRETDEAGKKFEDLQCLPASISTVQDAIKNSSYPMIQSRQSGHLHQPADVRDEVILGVSPEEDAFISPGSKPIDFNTNVVVKEEPIDFESGCFEFCEVVTQEPHCLKEENEADIVGSERVSHDSHPTNNCEIDSNGSFTFDSVHPNGFSSIEARRTGLISVKKTSDLVSTINDEVSTDNIFSTNNILSTNNLVSTNGSTFADGNSLDNAVVLDTQEGLPIGCVELSNIGSVDEVFTFVTTLSLDTNSLEEDEVQVEVSNKWFESRGENYVNLSILSGFPNPKVTRSISLTREGVQIFIHKQPLKTNHSIWSVLQKSTNLNTGQSLSFLAKCVEKMKICSGCLDQKCRPLWGESPFREKGFVETEFSHSSVYRSFSCHLLIDRAAVTHMCRECRADWVEMVQINSKRQMEAKKQRHWERANILRPNKR